MLVKDMKKLPADFPFEIQSYCQQRTKCENKDTSHWHNFFEITYVDEGNARYEVNGHIYDVESGDVILFNNSESHKWEVLTEEVRLTVLMFSSDIISDGSRMLDMDYLVPFLERGNNFENWIPGREKFTKDIKALLDEISEEDWRGQAGNRLMIKADILKILTLLVRYYERANSRIEFFAGKKDSVRRIEQAFTFIKKNYGKKITLEETAATVCMSPNYFSGYFKKTAGCSFQEYLTKIRMEKAKEMLHHSSDGILEIAQECGVSNTANFYRLYKKYYGIAPGEERHRQAI
ncbi:AraC-like DNA-binding protein [Muricomes intestini]|uniref:AraC-like DNA-binding protein n=2 Tax=Muricomes intestini TaxID=1796634 RepID=A0A4R3K2F6_9FIRM|nr:AraC-like DNA-binding protein [Muricomes intestini]